MSDNIYGSDLLDELIIELVRGNYCVTPEEMLYALQLSTRYQTDYDKRLFVVDTTDPRVKTKKTTLSKAIRLVQLFEVVDDYPYLRDVPDLFDIISDNYMTKYDLERSFKEVIDKREPDMSPAEAAYYLAENDPTFRNALNLYTDSMNENIHHVNAMSLAREFRRGMQLEELKGFLDMELEVIDA